MDSNQKNDAQGGHGKASGEQILQTEKCAPERKGADGFATFRNLPLRPETLDTVRQLVVDSKARLLKKKKKLKEFSAITALPPLASSSEAISFSCKNEQVGFNSVPDSHATSPSSVESTYPKQRWQSSVSNQIPPSFGRESVRERRPRETSDDRAYWYFILACSIVALLTAWPCFPNLIAGFLWACLLNVYLSMDRTASPNPESIGAPKDGNALHGIHPTQEKPVFKGWVNRLSIDYDPTTYHVRQTQSVLAVLQGSILRMLVPKNKVTKHSSCFETTSEPTFVSQRVFDLRGAKVVLRPQKLARRRWWSRKYPICVQLDAHRNVLAKMRRAPRIAAGDSSRTSSETKNGHRVLARSQSLLDINDEARTTPLSESTQELYIFARTTREKEQWFFQLLAATGSLSGSDAKRSDAIANDAEFGRTSFSLTPEFLFLQTVLSAYETYRVGLVKDLGPSMDTISMNLIDQMHRKDSVPPPLDEALFDRQISWVNAMISRTFFDFTTDHKWIKHVEWKIQRKLATLRLPMFLDALKLVALKPGSRSPSIRYIYEPTLDSWGLWVDFDIEYSGGFSLVLETKVNLMKLKSNSRPRSSSSDSKKTHYSDEEIPESPESSDDDDSVTPLKTGTFRDRSPKSQWSIKHFVDKVAHTKSFQGATDNRFVKKIIHGVSDTPLVLALEVPRLCGRFAVNFPPPPSNRIWYGFRSRPKASFKAVPKVGTLTVNISHVTDWIERKLKHVLEKSLVLPSMDDFIVPFRSFDTLYSRYNM
uniref:SMP-LTD domain-containing protein n=1 Tax=Trichuris muris TaxID=70415 RepID=A0A5S6R4J6_TRIMR